MATTFPIHPSGSTIPTSESEVVHSSYTLLKYAYGLVPIIAGADKFTNLIVNWEEYLNPMIPNLLNLTPHTFMLIVGVIEIIAGILVFAKPRLGAFVVMAWLPGHLAAARILGAAFRHRDSRHGDGAWCSDPRAALAFRPALFAAPRCNHGRPRLILLRSMR